MTNPSLAGLPSSNISSFHRGISAAGILIVCLSLVACSPPPLANTPPRNNTICCFGDSLVAGVGASTAESYPSQLALITGQPVASYGTSGDTTADGLTRLDRFDNQEFGIIIVTLGGNDILRRVQWDETSQNLTKLFRSLKKTGAVIVYTGVTGPLNPTRNRYYRKICEAEEVLFIPDILNHIISDPELKSDDVHPNAKGYRLIAQRVADALQQANLLSKDATTP